MPKKISKKEAEALEKKLAYKSRLVWDSLSDREEKELWKLSEDYKAFLNAAKTEREAVSEIARRLDRAGFRSVEHPRPGKKVYQVFRGKVLALAVLGSESLLRGLRLIASHIDAPRLDLKQNPLYEEVDLALLKTHYYGGIKKYQWLARPLALHGTVLRRTGEPVELVIGEKPDDPVFTVADLLPHLAKKVQMDKKLSEAIEGEKLNVLVGSLPLGPKEINHRFKLAVLNILHDRFQIVEEDLISAELEVVPAELARDVGLDRALVGSGRPGRSGERLLQPGGGPGRHAGGEDPGPFIFRQGRDRQRGKHQCSGPDPGDLSAPAVCFNGRALLARSLGQALVNTRALSADVAGALDPDYQEVHEKRNAPRLGYGLCLTKFTGSGGKIRV